MGKSNRNKSATAGNTGEAEVDAPAGFGVVKLDIPSVSWEKVGEIQGPVVDSDIFYSDSGPKRVLIVELNGEAHRVYEQGGLARLFDKVHVGDDVWIRTTGLRKLPGNKELRTFEGGIKPGRERTPIAQIPAGARATRSFTRPNSDGVINRREE